MRLILLLPSLLYKWGYWWAEIIHDIPKITLFISKKAGTEIRQLATKGAVPWILPTLHASVSMLTFFLWKLQPFYLSFLLVTDTLILYWHQDLYSLCYSLRICCCSVTRSCPTLWDPMAPLFSSVLGSLLKLMSIESESVMLSNHLIFCRPILLLSIFSSNRVFSSEFVLHIRWPKYGSFTFSINPSSEYSGLISFKMDWFDLLAVSKDVSSHYTVPSKIRLEKLPFDYFMLTFPVSVMRATEHSIHKRGKSRKHHSWEFDSAFFSGYACSLHGENTTEKEGILQTDALGSLALEKAERMRRGDSES